MLLAVHVRFDFTGFGMPLAREYHSPLKVLAALSQDEVTGVLKECQAELAEGHHIAGWLSYEAAPAFDAALSVKAGSPQGLPLACFGVYASAGSPGQLEAAAFSVDAFRADSTQAQHAAAVEEIRARIGAGETYQVNHTMRLKSQLRGSAAAYYRELLSRQPADWCAYASTPTHDLLSCSPELFFLRTGDRLVTRPMKGTARRSADPIADRVLAAELQASPKQRAENIMITDLLRNDLGRVARRGTVRVESLLDLESHPTFHALTSTVSAEAEEGAGLAEVVQALFPCGSVTGAPKRSTMAIIRELESGPRGIYCGTMGFADPDGTLAFNVAIRTVQHDRATGELLYGTGGGITWDSDATDEYHEALLKARFLQAPAQD